MFGILGAVFSFVGGLAPAISSFLAARQDSAAKEVVSASETERAEYVAYAQAQVAHLASRSSFIMVLAFGLPTAMHYGWTLFTSTFPQLGLHTDLLSPAYAAMEQKIALSFFIVAPTMAVVSRVMR